MCSCCNLTAVWEVITECCQNKGEERQTEFVSDEQSTEAEMRCWKPTERKSMHLII